MVGLDLHSPENCADIRRREPEESANHFTDSFELLTMNAQKSFHRNSKSFSTFLDFPNREKCSSKIGTGGTLVSGSKRLMSCLRSVMDRSYLFGRY